MMLPYLHFLSLGSMSVWLTVSFTVERYIVVCHPIRGKVLCTEGRAKCIIAIVFVMCLATTFSTLFEYQLDISSECEKVCDDPPAVNLLELNETHVQELLDVHKRLDELSPINNSEHLIIKTQLLNRHVELTKIMFTAPRLEEITSQYKASQNNALQNKPFQNRASQNRASDDMKIPKFCTDPGGGSRESSREDQKFGDTKVGNQTVCENLLNITTGNETCCKLKYTIGIKASNLGNNVTYRRYFFWFSSLYFGLIPLTLIATFNAFLVFAMFKSRRKRKRMTMKRRVSAFTAFIVIVNYSISLLNFGQYYCF